MRLLLFPFLRLCILLFLLIFRLSNTFFVFSSTSISNAYFLSAFNIFFAFSIFLSIVSMSASISSRFIVSISLKGSIFPSTCTMFWSSKHLTTSHILSTSLICDRNWFPKSFSFACSFYKSCNVDEFYYCVCCFFWLIHFG